MALVKLELFVATILNMGTGSPSAELPWMRLAFGLYCTVLVAFLSTWILSGLRTPTDSRWRAQMAVALRNITPLVFVAYYDGWLRAAFASHYGTVFPRGALPWLTGFLLYHVPAGLVTAIGLVLLVSSTLASPKGQVPKQALQTLEFAFGGFVLAVLPLAMLLPYF